jgi:glycerophosphoryl diester phosphodiesterase
MRLPKLSFHLFIFSIVMLLTTACNTGVIDLDIQGHRGCRGLMPENTLQAFEKAWEIGATTLEMDVVISRDSQVVVSHEAWFSHEFCSKPDGSAITEAEEKQYNIYQMDYADVMRYDCGQRVHPRFTAQQKMPVFKPLLSAAIAHIEEQYTLNQLGGREPRYSIELKTEPGSAFNPAPKEFVRLVLAELDALAANSEIELKSRINLQSFDLEVLREIRRQDRDMPIALLVEEGDKYKEQLSAFGEYPDILSPDFTQVDAEMLSMAATKNMKVIPWTVNEVADMRRLIQLGVHGIITDYPDRLVALLQEL